MAVVIEEVGKSAPPQSKFKLLFLAGGVLAFFTAFGYAQEKVTQATFGENGERFRDVSFLVLVQSFGNMILAAVLLFAQFGAKVDFSGGAPVRDWLVVSLGYLGAHQFGLAALKYIIFPMQVVCKSCKAIPVMFGETIFAHKQHTLTKKLSVVLMCAGVVAFTLLGKSKVSQVASASETAFGLFLVALALCCDGLYGPYQNRICQKFSPSAYHLMFNMNFWEFVFSFVICASSGSLRSGFDFIVRNPDILPLLALFAVTMALGNVFIYQLQRNFGALVVTQTTTMRKIISVLFSVLWFGHHVMPLQWIGVVVVFFSSHIARYVVGFFEPKKDEHVN